MSLHDRANALLDNNYSATSPTRDDAYLGVKANPVCACPAVAGAVATGALAEAGAFTGGAAVVTGAYALGKAIG